MLTCGQNSCEYVSLKRVYVPCSSFAQTGYTFHAGSASPSTNTPVMYRAGGPPRFSGNCLHLLLPTPPVMYGGLQHPACTAATSAGAAPVQRKRGTRSRLLLPPTPPACTAPEAAPVQWNQGIRSMLLLPLPPTPVMYSASAETGWREKWYYNQARVPDLRSFLHQHPPCTAVQRKQSIRSELLLSSSPTPVKYSASAETRLYGTRYTLLLLPTPPVMYSASARPGSNNPNARSARCPPPPPARRRRPPAARRPRPPAAAPPSRGARGGIARPGRRRGRATAGAPRPHHGRRAQTGRQVRAGPGCRCCGCVCGWCWVEGCDGGVRVRWGERAGRAQGRRGRGEGGEPGRRLGRGPGPSRRAGAAAGGAMAAMAASSAVSSMEEPTPVRAL